jgi:hypothetical protein
MGLSLFKFEGSISFLTQTITRVFLEIQEESQNNLSFIYTQQFAQRDMMDALYNFHCNKTIGKEIIVLFLSHRQ